jgi:uncharacterized membrane protein YsdA (DUF1294 family)/cold shock CspA family protein
MKLKGTLREWNEDKQYGFILPSGGGPDVFAHISAFQNRFRKPMPGDVVFYHPEKRKDGRHRAAFITYGDDKMGVNMPQFSERGVWVAMLFSSAFLVAMSFFGCLRLIPWELVALYLVMSVITFLMYRSDKSAARKKRWRTQEKSLLVCGLIGGWPGALIAQQVFRHKSSKIGFQVMFWCSVAINCACLGLLLMLTGS